MENTAELTVIKGTAWIGPERLSNMLQAAREQEQCIMKLMESLERRSIKRSDSRDLSIYRAKMIGMIDILQLAGIDCNEFKWIYNLL